MWLHFGFGRIGKALISPFLEKIGDYAIMDRNFLHSSKENVELVFPNGKVQKIDNINLVAKSEIDFSRIKVISTSVIVSNIDSLLPYIQQIIDRAKATIAIVPFENSFEAREIFEKGLTGNFVVLDSVIDKIVSNSEENTVFCEEFSMIKIDKDICKFANVPDKYISQNIEQEHKIKFYLLNGIHAFIAYLGFEIRKHNKDIKYIDDVLKTHEWKEAKAEMVELYKKFMLQKFNLDEKYVMDYINTSIERFKQPLHDEIERVGRNPNLKLMDNERLEPIKSSHYFETFRKTNLKNK